MVLRVLHYVSGLYLDHLLTHGVRETERLPAVLPIVLYNGDETWTAPTSIGDLIADYPPLGEYKPAFDYLKIAENEFSLGRLLGIRNIISALFIVEAHYDLSLLEDLLLALYDEEPDREAIYLFLNWLKQLALYGRIDEEKYGSLTKVIRSKEEVKSMLLTAIEREKKQIREEGGNLRAQQIALAMIAQGFAPQQIADLTGLTIAQVIDLHDHAPAGIDTPADE